MGDGQKERQKERRIEWETDEQIAREIEVWRQDENAPA